MFRGSLIFLFMFTLLLGACGTGLPSTLDDTLSIQGAEDELRDTATLTINNLPDEVMLKIFSQLSVTDLIQASQVCKHWYGLSEDSALWRAVRLRIHGDYPENEATKEQAKNHMLRVHVNTLSDFTTIEGLVKKYKLNEEHPFGVYKDLLVQLYIDSSNTTAMLIDNYAAQGNEKAIHRKIAGLGGARSRYEKNPQAAAIFIESLIEQGNQDTINCKIWGLAHGSYGYAEDPEAAVALNEFLVEQGNEKAIKQKIEGLARGQYGYAEDPEAAVALNEFLVEQGNEKAIERKITGLTEGRSGYEYKPKAAAILNEFLVEQGNEQAIERKIGGLAHGSYGYEKNPKAAIAFNDSLVDKGNKKAIKRKIEGLSSGWDGYEKNPQAAVAFNDSLVEQGNEAAIHWKIEGLLNGRYGYKQDFQAAAILIGPLIEQDNYQAIRRKIKSFNSHHNGDIKLKKMCIEEAYKGKRWACYLKAQGMKYGILGFKKDIEAAIEYILSSGIPY
ncbi:MAG: F-box protein [Candidatus Amoebophilus sp.]